MKRRLIGTSIMPASHTAKYSSTNQGPLVAMIPTRLPGSHPSDSSAPARRNARSWVWAKLWTRSPSVSAGRAP